MLIGGDQHQWLALVDEIVRIGGMFANRTGEQAMSQKQAETRQMSLILSLSDYRKCGVDFVSTLTAVGRIW